MTDETEVDTAELHTFANGMRGRGDSIVTASEKVGSIDYGPGTFGVIGQLFNTSAQEAAARTPEGLMHLGKNVSADATAVSDAATEYDTNEQIQTQQYGGVDVD